jgi:uncharacterized membrane protein
MVCVGDRLYMVSVRTGKRIRIPYKPRGPGAYGYQWIGRVHSIDDGERITWEDIVGGSLGVRGLLRYAGVLDTSVNPAQDTPT